MRTDQKERLETIRRKGILLNLRYGIRAESRLPKKPEYAIIQENRANPYHDPETGRFTSGGGGKKGKTKYAPSPQRDKTGVQFKDPGQIGKLCGILNTRYPNLKAGEKAVIRDSKCEYHVTADGNGGMRVDRVYAIIRRKRK